MSHSKVLAGMALMASAIAVPLIALAQPAPEEIIVTGEFGRVPDSVRSLSQSVSYADLDLTTKTGRDEMRRRVNLTARFLCDKLGENDTSTSVAPSCRAAATKDALNRLGTLEASSAPRGTTWVSPPAWSAPYPADWSKRYP